MTYVGPGAYCAAARTGSLVSVTALEPRTRDVIPAPLALVAAGLVALALGRVLTLVSPLLLALVIGAVAANLGGRSRWRLADPADATRLLLRAGVVLLGFRLQLSDLSDIGVRGVVVVVAVVVVTYLGTCWLGDRMGLDRGLVTLIAAGCAVCGAAAIAAVEGGIRRRGEHVALAIALVTLLGTGAIVALPLAARLLGLSEQQSGVWIGASVHEVAQVVAAASVAGAGAVAVAMTVKLGRVALLAVVYAMARGRARAEEVPAEAGPLVPWFVLGFLAAAGVRSTGVVPPVALTVVDGAATVLLAAAMCGLGLGLAVRRLLPIPMAAVGLSLAATGLAVGTSLVLTVALF
jgi:uncharacterized integral membrane protein (TIGR00698 family)